jgi:hypothetical protein
MSNKIMEEAMDCICVENLLRSEYQKAGQANFVLSMPGLEFRSLLTSLRHIIATGGIDSYAIIDEDAGTVQIYGYIPQP